MIKTYQGKKIEVVELNNGMVGMTYNGLSMVCDECNERMADKLIKLSNTMKGDA